MADNGRGDEMAGLASLMQHKIREKPKLLSPSAGERECCIFRVPGDLLKINEEAYYPHVVSIGPYHHGEEQLKMLEEHKWRFLSSLLARCEPHGIHLQELIDAVLPEEERIKESYSECIDKFRSSELVMMMVLDGCFIIELLSMVGHLVQQESNEPIFKVTWILTAVVQDLYKLENQIPYFILEILFEITRASRAANANAMTTTLASLVLNFFNYGMLRPSHIIDYYINRINDQTAPVRHLLDLYRTSFVMPIYDNDSYKYIWDDDKPHPEVIQSTQKLRKAGIKFRLKESAKSFLEISFNKGILEIPFLKLDTLGYVLLLNFLSFEQCYSHYPQTISSYVMFMGYLINSSDDSEYLQSKEIIDKLIGTHEEVAHVFNQLYKNIYIDVDEFYLLTVFERINKYCSNKWRVEWAGIKHKYLGTPWAGIAALGALFGLLLTATETLFSVLGYVKDENLLHPLCVCVTANNSKLHI